MKPFRIPFALVTLLVLVCFGTTVSASVIGDLKTSSGNGTITMTLSSFAFNPDTGSNPPGPPWNGQVTNTTTLRFAGCPSGVLGTAGCLDSGPFTPAEAVEFANNVPITAGAGLGPNNPFISFAGNGITHATILYTITSLGPGSSNTNCAALVNIGDSCAVFAGSPVLLTLGAVGTTFTLAASGTVNDGAGITNWVGGFTFSDSTRTPGQVQSFFCPTGTCTAADFASGRAITVTNQGDFLSSAPVPEPGTVAMMVIGGALALVSRRRKHARTYIRALKMGAVVLAVLVLAVLVPPASANVIGDLKVTSGNGTMTITLSSLTLNTDTASNPPGPPWNGEVSNTTTLKFSGCPSGVLGTAGCLDSGPFTPAEAIEFANNLPIITGGGFAANNPFIQFAGNGTTHATILYTITGMGPGSANTNCTALVSIGNSCSIFAGSPLILTLAATGTTLTLAAVGTVTDAVGVTNWLGEFTLFDAGMTPAQIQSFFCTGPGNTCTAADFASGRSITKSWAGDFDPFVVAAVPEPGTLAMMLLAGCLMALWRIRRFSGWAS